MTLFQEPPFPAKSFLQGGLGNAGSILSRPVLLGSVRGTSRRWVGNIERREQCGEAGEPHQTKMLF